MKIVLAIMITLLLFGFILPGRYDKRVTSGMETAAGRPDGPYVLYKNGMVHTKYVQENNGVMTVSSDLKLRLID